MTQYRLTLVLASAVALLGCSPPVEAPDAPAPDAAFAPQRSWAVVRAPAPGADNLMGLWADGPHRLFAVGQRGTILRIVPVEPMGLDDDGKPLLSFVRMESGTDKDLTDVSGTGPSDVYAVGLGGTILRYDGSTWQREIPMRAKQDDPPFSADLWGVYAYPGGAIAVGNDGHVTKRVMGAWQPPYRLPVESLAAVWGTGANNIYAVGSLGYVFQHRGVGTSWTPRSPPGFVTKLAGIFGGGGQVFAVGLGGALLRQGDPDAAFADLGARIDARCGSHPLPKTFLRGGVLTPRSYLCGDMAMQGEALILIGWEGAIVRIHEGGCPPAPACLGAHVEAGAAGYRLEGIAMDSTGMDPTVYVSGVEGLVLRLE